MNIVERIQDEFASAHEAAEARVRQRWPNAVIENNVVRDGNGGREVAILVTKWCRGINSGMPVCYVRIVTTGS